MNCKVLTVSEARRWEWPKDSGQFNEDYELTLEGQDKPAILTQKPTTAPPKVGDTLDLDLEPHPRFDGKLKAKRVRQFQGGGGGGKSPEQQNAIQRQHSQEMALRYAAIRAEKGQLPEPFSLEDLRKVIDWFENDINPAGRQPTVKGLPVRNEPVQTGAPDSVTPSADYPAGPVGSDDVPFAGAA
jgi:hypothetical protein